MFEGLRHDVREAAAAVTRNPGFAAVVMVTLAVGIGANATIFSLLDAVMFKPLPVADAHELYVLHEQPPGSETVDVDGGSDQWTRFSYWRFERLREATPRPAELAAMTRTTPFDVRGPAAQSGGRANVLLVSGQYFDVFRVVPAAGRLLSDDDNRQVDGHPVAVLSFAFWQQRFGGDPEIVGRTVSVNRVPFTVVGVAREGFAGERVERPVDLWIPLAMQHAVRYSSNVASYGNTVRENEPWIPQERIAWLYLVLRAPEPAEGARVRLAQAYRQDLDHYATGITDRPFVDALLTRRLGVTSFEAGFSSLRRTYGVRLVVLMGMVAALLLAACANVANLLLARAAIRQREIGIRLALGAGRMRIVRQVLIECALLSAAGTVVGILVARWSAAFIATRVLDTRVLPPAFSVDARVVAFCAGLSALTALGVGVVPALRATRADAWPQLSGRAPARGSTRGMGSLVVLQFACSFVLVLAGVWFAQTLVNLSRVETGFARDRLVSVFVNTRNSAYTREERQALYTRLVDRVQALPGVESAAFAECTLATGCSSTSDLQVDGLTAPSPDGFSVSRNWVMPGYFSTVGMRIVRGRAFEPGDAQRPVAIVNESFAARFFGARDPIGARIGTTRPDTEIIGVVADARVVTVKTPPVPMYYLPLREPAYAFSLDVRVSGNPDALVQPIERALATSEPQLIFDAVTTMNDRVARSVLGETLVAYLTVAFCAATLLLAALGLYGLISYRTARRTAEIGVRVALGAQRHDIVRLVAMDALRLVAVGVVVGAGVALAGQQLVETLLFGVSAGDPRWIALVMGTLLSAAAAACYLPARRATLLNPVTALKTE